MKKGSEFTEFFAKSEWFGDFIPEWRKALEAKKNPTMFAVHFVSDLWSTSDKDKRRAAALFANWIWDCGGTWDIVRRKLAPQFTHKAFTTPFATLFYAEFRETVRGTMARMWECELIMKGKTPEGRWGLEIAEQSAEH